MLAASVVLTFAFGILQWKDTGSQDYARLAIEHVMHEPESFTSARLADPELFRRVMHTFGGEMQASLGKVRFMKLCPVPEGTGWHIVFETEQGQLATLILIPGKRMQAQSEQAKVGGWNALARPGGQGFYAVITDSPDSLGQVDALVRSACAGAVEHRALRRPAGTDFFLNISSCKDFDCRPVSFDKGRPIRPALHPKFNRRPT
ncbi:MAG: DUF3379 family protein [Ideonella sp.]|nr:DUF3379 family protein [Ideonella sp.]